MTQIEQAKEVVLRLKDRLEFMKTLPLAEPLDILILEERLDDAETFLRILESRKRQQEETQPLGSGSCPELFAPVSTPSEVEVAEHIAAARRRAERRLGLR